MKYRRRRPPSLRDACLPGDVSGFENRPDQPTVLCGSKQYWLQEEWSFILKYCTGLVRSDIYNTSVPFPRQEQKKNGPTPGASIVSNMANRWKMIFSNDLSPAGHECTTNLLFHDLITIRADTPSTPQIGILETILSTSESILVVAFQRHCSTYLASRDAVTTFDHSCFSPPRRRIHCHHDISTSKNGGKIRPPAERGPSPAPAASRPATATQWL
jgi:hypothetical protein